MYLPNGRYTVLPDVNLWLFIAIIALTFDARVRLYSDAEASDMLCVA